MGLTLVEFIYPEEVEEFNPGKEAILSIGRYRFKTPYIENVYDPFLSISETSVLKFGYTINIHVGGLLNPIPDEPHTMSDEYSLDHIKRVLENARGQKDPKVKNRYLDVMYASTFPLFRIDDIIDGSKLKITLDKRIKLLSK